MVVGRSLNRRGPAKRQSSEMQIKRAAGVSETGSIAKGKMPVGPHASEPDWHKSHAMN